ncbi:MAG: hypothetical protein OXH73_10340 [Caldilineaceae bacterium]|nr:hypothetical protein [Caldilineaceae bacterium]
MKEEKKSEVDYDEKMKIGASPQEVLGAIFRQADLPERISDTIPNSDKNGVSTTEDNSSED